MSRNATKKDIARRTAQHIINKIDHTDWHAIRESVNPCHDCPARGGPQEQSGEILSLCLACPLRPLMLDLADLEMRVSRGLPSPDEL
uniref:Uncharacterized protein n=1 Tax=uncultured prokaryote TaxID=198431 RepID=A0A0H5Q6S4_9ZZZZ|nr:hypothetical protein [uncultured prokaryote]